MYRDYLNTSLTTDKLKEINRNSAENTKYCNGICQDIRNIDEFSGKHVFCNKCRNYFTAVYFKMGHSIFNLIYSTWIILIFI